VAKVKIDTPGVTIEIDDSASAYDVLSKQAMSLFKEATEIMQVAQPMRIGFGNGGTERRWTPAHQNIHKHRRTFDPVHAETDM